MEALDSPNPHSPVAQNYWDENFQDALPLWLASAPLLLSPVLVILWVFFPYNPSILTTDNTLFQGGEL